MGKKGLAFFICLLALSICFAYMGLKYGSLLYGVLSFAVVIIILKAVPFCRGYEPTWVFIITFAVFMPFNIKYVSMLSLGIAYESSVFIRAVVWAAAYFMFLAAEEIFMGVVTRGVLTVLSKWEDEIFKGRNL